MPARRPRPRGRAPRPSRRIRRARSRSPRARSSRQAPLGELTALVDALVRGRGRIPRVAPHDRAAADPQPRPQDLVARHALDRRGERSAVPDRHQQRAPTVCQEAAEHVEFGRDDRQVRGERLERGQPEALLHRREREHVGRAVQALDRVGAERAEHPHVLGDSQLAGARREAVELMAVVEQRRPAGDQEHRIALRQRLPQAREALQQAERPLARLDSSDREHSEPPPEPRPAAVAGALRRIARRAEPRRVDPVRNQPGGDAELGGEPLDPGARDAYDAIGSGDRALLALDQRRRREVVDVVHGADDVFDDALIAQRQRGVRRQAVLRVHDVVAARREDHPQAVGIGFEHRLDALVERRLERHVPDDAQRQLGRPEELLLRTRQGRQLDLMPTSCKRLGDLECVHNAAARLDRVGQHRDAQAHAGAPATARAASRAAVAFVGATTTPAERRVASWRAASCGSPAVPQTCAITTRPAPSRSRAGASPAAGSSCAPCPITTSSRTQPTRSSAAACSSIPSRVPRSTIGCGRPCVYSSSPRSKIAWPPAWPPVPEDEVLWVSPALPPIPPSAGRRIVTASCASEPPEYRPTSRRAVPSRRASTCASRSSTTGGATCAAANAPASSVGWISNGVSPPSQPTNALTTRLPASSIVPSARTTSGAGGLDTSRSVSVASSAASIRIAARNMIPPICADRSRPPTPTMCETPIPAPSSSTAASCAPVPAAATMPTGPGRTTFANPSPTLPSIAVPQPGPIRSSPRAAARRLSSSSSAADTWSENRNTCSPAVSARCASSTAYSPGTEISATLASPSVLAAAPSERGAASAGRSPTAVGAASSPSARSRTATASASAASTAITTSAGPASALTPRPASASRLAGGPIAISARTTAECSLARCASFISRTLST